ncbi:bcl-2-associated transcription factor 1-like [Anguilla rostrata]|uniref:bcl-2-associated transcription factor 1-like n=1 Tax=Anguilla rostrata TaxID=7938 RepID=UPI0030CC3DE5
MVRSKSRTHSSRSRSRSLSRSRSRTRSRSRSRTRSRKKRYSSRSRSRSYSRSRSRDRNYPREYRRDFRGNRGMRRPYGFRGRGRGLYPGGGRFHHRGGFRPNWHNRRYSRSPRRGRSRSRTPKRRSASQRSRSQSRHSGRSSGSRRSSRSSSSSRSSPSPNASRRRVPRDKAGKKGEEGGEGAGPGEGNGDRPAGAPAGVFLAKSELKRPALVPDSWLGVSAYDDGSPSLSSAPPGQSSSHPVVPPASSVHPRSEGHSPDSALGQYSPAHSPRGRSPGEVFSASTGSRGVFLKSDKQDLQKGGKFFKRYAEEEEEGDSRTSRRERGASSWDSSKPQTDSVPVKGGWGAAEPGPGPKKKGEKVPFIGDSPDVPAEEEEGEEEEDEEEDESQAYRQPYKFRLSSQSESVKPYLGEPHWGLDDPEDRGKYAGKALKAGREGGGACLFKDPGYVLKRPSKDGHSEEGKGAERREDRPTGKRDTPTSWHVKAGSLKELITQGPLLQKVVDVRDKAPLRNESPSGARPGSGEGPRPEVKVKMAAKAFESVSVWHWRPAAVRAFPAPLAPISGRPGRHSPAHKSSQPPESFILHIVSLVHHVQEHYFKATGVTLHERFTVYQKAAVEQEARHKSPEIHRRIDISPSAFKKVRLFKEDLKGEGKTRSEPVDLRQSIDRRRKERSREGEGRRDSRETSPSAKPEKPGKELKDYKDYKSLKEESKRKSKERERSRSSSGSSLSRDDKDRRRGAKEEEEGKPHHEPKDYPGYQGAGTRARGTFQFRIRGGRGRARGVFGGPVPGPSAPNTPFPQRPKEEEWDPEYTPRSRKYFLHDDRDDGTDYWAKRGRGRGLFQRGRGRLPFKKSNSSPKWTHDKYQGEGTVEEDEEDNNEEGEEREEKHKEEKVE